MSIALFVLAVVALAVMPSESAARAYGERAIVTLGLCALAVLAMFVERMP